MNKKEILGKCNKCGENVIFENHRRICSCTPSSEFKMGQEVFEVFHHRKCVITGIIQRRGEDTKYEVEFLDGRPGFYYGEGSLLPITDTVRIADNVGYGDKTKDRK